MGDKAATVKSCTDEQVLEKWVFSLPKHWRQHTSPTSLRKNLQWFWSLFNAYDTHTQICVDTISESSRNGEPICYPKSIEDEDFDKFVLRSYSSRESQRVPSPPTREQTIQLQIDVSKDCIEKKKMLIKLGEILSGYSRWKRDVKELCDKNIEAKQSLTLKEEANVRLKRQVEDLKHVQHHSEIMSKRLKQVTKEKEDLLIRLSKIAGSKLTSNNPDIADLSDDNRPTKLAEKFSQLYDDAWTDSLEELTEVETKLDDTVAISFLLRIVMTAYKFCRRPRSMFLDLSDCQTIITSNNLKDTKVLTKLPESSKVEIKPRTQRSLHAKETVSEMQKKFHVILTSIIRDITRKEKFRPSVSDKSETNPWELDEDEVKETNRSSLCSGFTVMHIKDIYVALQGSKEEPANLFRHTEELSKRKTKKNSMSAISDFLQQRYEIFSNDGTVLKKKDIEKIFTPPIESQKKTTGPKNKFPKTTHFAERCVELCWFMQLTQPPINLSARIPDDGMMNTDIFKAYMKSGTKVEYIVWPIMYLHENGPLLTKGIAQPK